MAPIFDRYWKVFGSTFKDFWDAFRALLLLVLSLVSLCVAFFAHVRHQFSHELFGSLLCIWVFLYALSWLFVSTLAPNATKHQDTRPLASTLLLHMRASRSHVEKGFYFHSFSLFFALGGSLRLSRRLKKDAYDFKDDLLRR